jgi:FG-GAP repeat
MSRVAAPVGLASDVGTDSGGWAGLSRRWTLAGALVALAAGALLHLGLGGSRSPLEASAARPHSLSQESLLSLPGAAQDAVTSALGADEAVYRIGPGRGGFIAANPAQHTTAMFTSSGFALDAGATHVALGLPAVGYGSVLTPVATADPRARANRVAYTRPGVSEWYANGPLGIEQGFTIPRPPAGSVAGPVVTLSMALSGNAVPKLDAGGQGLLLTRSGRSVLRYGDLTVTDARGRSLHSWLALSNGRLLLRIDAARARYPVRIDPLIQTAELTASDGTKENYLGTVAISGNMIVAGASSREVESHPNQGAVYVFEELGSGWKQTAELTASTGELDDEVGTSVAVSGNTVVAGGSGRDEEHGAVYVFERSGGGSGWKQVALLTASDGARADRLGRSVALSGNTIVAGAPVHEVGKDHRQGAVYVFEKPASGWEDGTQTAELTVAGGGEAEELGFSAAMSGSTVVAGAANYSEGRGLTKGAVYVFERPLSGWAPQDNQTAELTASDGVLGDALGTSVAVSGNTIVAGAPFHKATASSDGAVYAFERLGPAWVSGPQTAELTASDGDEQHYFGNSLALSGNTLLVGSIASLGAGRLYVFERPASGWETAAEPLAFPASGGDGPDIGASVALEEGTVVAGEPLHEVGSHYRQGAVFVFGIEPSAPAVVTGIASVVGPTSATLNGTVNPDGAAVTSCTFRYGTTTSYGASVPCSALPGSGRGPVAVAASLSDLAAGTSYHYRIVAENARGSGEGADETFATAAASTAGGSSSTAGGSQPSTSVASTPKAIEEVLLGCTKSALVLNDVLIHGSRVDLTGSAAKSLVGKKVKIVFDSRKQVATATVGANGRFSTTAPLPPASIRDSNSARYMAEQGRLRSTDLKLNRRLILEPPKASGTTVTLVGQVVPPLTKPVGAVAVEQQFECGKTTIAKTFTPPASGRFHITVSVPADARAAIFTLRSVVAANAHATRHGFATYSLPLAVALG